ncbi:MAG: hypothetical protein RR288_07310, partial [Oscillibacter sp.]
MGKNEKTPGFRGESRGFFIKATPHKDIWDCGVKFFVSLWKTGGSGRSPGKTVLWERAKNLQTSPWQRP